MGNDNDLGLIAFMSGLREGKKYAEKRRPLTDEEMRALWERYGYQSALCMEFARAIERAHGIGEKE